ncbi:Protein sidekick-2 [Bagarius yarrelli]|uniref:Protein sidekick-2 n=1 Tax=Bagarius yarrelli TaxID=175774 RepID=A0A556VWY0_BAGYA|nr:Protein sidekick-2 [Bagarius yarrelli]
MECVANARPLIKLSISWRRNGVSVRSGLSDFNRRLTILSPTVIDSGFYECEAELRSSSVPSVSAGAFLHVLEPPQFRKEPEKHITAEIEKVVDIPCQAKGVPQPDIVWYKDAILISPLRNPRYHVLAGGSLQINGLLPDDTGMFQCFARNAAGEVQTNTYLAVTSIAPNITAGPSDSIVIDGMSIILHSRTYISTPPQDQSVIKGTKATLTCGVSHDPNVTVRFVWEKDGQVVNSRLSPRLRVDINGTLHISQTCYRLTGLPVDIQYKNISNPEVTNLLLEDLIIWTNYEMEVAAFNWAGLGVYSHRVMEWTLQGEKTIDKSPVTSGAGLELPALAEAGTGVQSQRLDTPGTKPVNGDGGDVEMLDEPMFRELNKRKSQGYRISWEEFNRTNTRVTHYLPNVTLEYRVTGLTALTTYTIEVAAMTSKGQGQLSSSTISSGVPPELPGPPTNLAISNIGPRSVTLQFKPGYDGKTSISRWQVEAQISVIGENEDWVMVHQLINEPHTRSMEIPALNPYTFYRFRMRQVNIVGTSPPSQPSRKIQTLQAPPDMAPINITLRTASETSLWLRWVPLPEWEYNGNPESVGYKVQYSLIKPQAKVRTHVIPDRMEREFTIEDLEEWTEYEVKVQAINGIGAGPWSPPARGRTRESVPSCGPLNVSAFSTSSSSILVRWFEVPEPDRNGLILGYKVVYKEKDADSSLQFWTVEGNTTNSAELTHLGKYVLYEIWVLAFTRIGDGLLSSPPILERTLDDVPGPPVGILFPEVRISSVRLIWQSPAQPNGIILAYQISYRLNSSSSISATVDILNPSARQYTVNALKPESVYMFSITAQTRKGWGEAAEALVVTTEKRARPQPPRHLAVPQENVRARSIVLLWEPGSDGLSPVRYYTVQIRELPDQNWTVQSASVNHEAASAYRVERLKPFTSYQFRVKATNDIGDSDYSRESETITTLQDEEKINGILLGFRVRYRELLYERSNTFNLQKHFSWNEQTDLYSVRNITDPFLKHYELDIPTAPPQNVAVHSATATQLDVTWDPPPLDRQNGDIQGYKVYFWEYERKNESEKLKTLFLPDKGVKLKNLTGFTTYMISVAPFNAAGDGPRSSPTRGRTQQAVNVSWAEPLFPNGLIAGYRLVYEPCSAIHGQCPKVNCSHMQTSTHRPVGVSKIVTVDVKGNAPLWLKIKDLVDGVTYNFRIRAKTFTYGPELEANITTGPGEGAPGPPGEPFISRYGSTFTIHWSSGDPGRAPISRYVIEARPSDEGLWDILIKDIPKEVTSYTFNMDLLRQGVSYDFRIIGVNDYGYGSPSQPSPSVSGNSPNCTTLTHGEMVGLDESRFPTLELNNRRLSVKTSFNRKNGIYTRLVFIYATHTHIDSECEGEVTLQNQTHSFVNHYISDPTYYNSWRRQQKGISRAPHFTFSQAESTEPTPATGAASTPDTPPSPAHAEPQSLFRPKGSRTPTPLQQSSAQSTLYFPPSNIAPTASPRPPSSLAPPTTPRPPIAGFSSFV